MVSFADVLFVVGILVSLGICGLGVYSYRRWDEPGIRPFVVFVVLLGIGGVAGGVGTFLFGRTFGNGKLWAQVSLLTLLAWSVPWALFGLQYTGRYTHVRWRRVVLAYLPSVGVLVVAVSINRFLETPATVTTLVGGIVFLYLFFLFGVGIYLLLQATHRYGHLSLAQGASLSFAPVVHFLLVNTSNPVETTATTTFALMYVLAYAVPALVFAVGLFRYEMFDSTPAIGAIGERDIARETDDLLIVVDDRDRVIRLNDSAVETLRVNRERALGTALGDLVPEDPESFREQQTVTLETTAGSRQFDPQVSTITDQHDRELGALLSLRDVTDRELREQRLSVLNRVLRHNLRNKIEVVRAHAEVIDNQNGHAETILAASDEIAGLGESARTVDQFVSESDATASLDIASLVTQTVAEETADSTAVTVSMDLPESAPLETNGRALRSALRSAIENAVTYAESAVEISVERSADGYRISVADDGPGIPQGELDSLDNGTETPLQHGTGLGLWQLKWAVRTLDGGLSFDTTDGTTVVITVPDSDHTSARA